MPYHLPLPLLILHPITIRERLHPFLQVFEADHFFLLLRQREHTHAVEELDFCKERLHVAAIKLKEISVLVEKVAIGDFVAHRPTVFFHNAHKDAAKLLRRVVGDAESECKAPLQARVGLEETRFQVMLVPCNHAYKILFSLAQVLVECIDAFARKAVTLFSIAQRVRLVNHQHASLRFLNHFPSLHRRMPEVLADEIGAFYKRYLAVLQHTQASVDFTQDSNKSRLADTGAAINHRMQHILVLHIQALQEEHNDGQHLLLDVFKPHHRLELSDRRCQSVNVEKVYVARLALVVFGGVIPVKKQQIVEAFKREIKMVMVFVGLSLVDVQSTLVGRVFKNANKLRALLPLGIRGGCVGWRVSGAGRWRRRCRPLTGCALHFKSNAM